MATKIDTIKLGTSEYEIDLKSTATPSIASLTTSGLTVNGDAWADAIATKSIDVGELKLDINGITGPGVDVPISAESGSLLLTASEGDININRTTNESNPATGSINIVNTRGDITLGSLEGNINIDATTSTSNSGGKITLGPATVNPGTIYPTISLKGAVTMFGPHGSATVSNGYIKTTALAVSVGISTPKIEYPSNTSNNTLGIKLTSTNITLSSGNATGASISVISPHGSIYLSTNDGKIVLSTSGTSASNTLTISKHNRFGVSVSAGQGLYVTANNTNKTGGLILDLSVGSNSDSRFYLKPPSVVNYVTGTWLVLATDSDNYPQLVWYTGTTSSSYLNTICEVRTSLNGSTLRVYIRSAINHSQQLLASISYTTASYYCYIKDAHLIRLT